GGDSVQAGDDGRFAAPWSFGQRPRCVRAVLPGAGAVTETLRPGADQPGWVPELPITLQLPLQPGIVRGRVIDANGAPAAGIYVWTPDLTWLGNVTVEHQGHRLSSPSSVEGVANNPNGGMDAVFELGTTTDADGRFALHGLMDRSYTLFGMAPTSLVAAGPMLASPGDDVELRLASPRLQPVAGRIVTRQGGEPLAGVNIVVGRAMDWQRPQRD